MFEHFRGDWAYAEPHFFNELSKNFIFKIFTLVLLVGFLDVFGKFRLFTVKIGILIWYFWVVFENYSMRMLSIRGNNFITCWAYAEPISSHTEHTRNFRTCSACGKCEQFLHVISMLSISQTNFIAHWTYGERISSHAEHTWNRFYRMLSMRGNVLKVKYIGRIEYNFQKSRVTGPWDHMVSVSAKKVKKKNSCLCTFNCAVADTRLSIEQSPPPKSMIFTLFLTCVLTLV